MSKDYLMENDEEALRLDIKTDPLVVEQHARWAGLGPGMRAADIGCGPGKTTSVLSGIVTPSGEVVGMDFSDKRIEFAKRNYSSDNTVFINRDIREPLDDTGKFDFIWIRFVLEYYLESSVNIVSNAVEALKPGGIICLVDLDHNCLGHYGLSDRLDRTVHKVMGMLQEKADFDPFVGRKLYSYLYDMKLENIDMRLDAHHLIFGPLKESDSFNWIKKVEAVANMSGFTFDEYEGGYEEFRLEFEEFFTDERRFTYTPVILCRGQKPA